MQITSTHLSSNSDHRTPLPRTPPPFALLSVLFFLANDGHYHYKMLFPAPACFDTLDFIVYLEMQQQRHHLASIRLIADPYSDDYAPAR